jgi:hypothetical protein
MPTFTQIGSAVTVGSGGAASVSFSSIPSTYTDLVVKLSARNTYAALSDWVQIQFNGSGSSYSYRVLQGAGSGTPASYNGTSQYAGDAPAANSTASTFGNWELYVPNYAGATNKSYSIDAVTENNGTDAIADLDAGLWSDTSAITSITLTLRNGNFAQHSTAYLYGVSNA